MHKAFTYLRVGVLAAGVVIGLAAVGGNAQITRPAKATKLVVVAELGAHQATGVAISSKGRIFVCFPNWKPTADLSVAEITPTGDLKAYPDADWNKTSSSPPLDAHFVSVQGVWIDPQDNLWILDSASPQFKGVVAGGPKLVQVDLKTNQVTRVIPFDEAAVPSKSYLNDVRVDAAHDAAYITDSGLGALLVVNLKDGKARRVLENTPATQIESGVPLAIEGKPVLEGGKPPVIHVDGIALDANAGLLYFHSLMGKTLYRVRTTLLANPATTEAELAKGVEAVDTSGPCDGMVCDSKGDVYMTAIEKNAILCRSADGKVVTVVQDKELVWPDSLAIGPDHMLYVTSSRVNEMARFNAGKDIHKGDYKLFRVEGWDATRQSSTPLTPQRNPAPVTPRRG